MTGGKAEQAWNYISHKSGGSDLLGELLAAFEREVSSQTADESHDELSSLPDPSQVGQTVQYRPDQTGVHHEITLQRETEMFKVLWACAVSAKGLFHGTCLRTQSRALWK